MKLIYLLLFLLSASNVSAGEVIRHYVQSYNITGYTGTEFDKTGNKTGYLKNRDGRIILYDKNWRRRGYKNGG